MTIPQDIINHPDFSALRSLSFNITQSLWMFAQRQFPEQEIPKDFKQLIDDIAKLEAHLVMISYKRDT